MGSGVCSKEILQDFMEVDTVNRIGGGTEEEERDGEGSRGFPIGRVEGRIRGSGYIQFPVKLESMRDLLQPLE